MVYLTSMWPEATHQYPSISKHIYPLRPKHVIPIIPIMFVVRSFLDSSVKEKRRHRLTSRGCATYVRTYMHTYYD